VSSLHLVLGSADGGVAVHVRALVPALIRRGWQVSVSAPEAVERAFGFAAAGARFTPIEIRSAAPTPGQWARARRLRQQLAGADVVHAHGLRAGAVAVLAGRRPLVVTWHNLVIDSVLSERGGSIRSRAARRARGAVAALGERLVARGATVTLGASGDLVQRARRRGARDARLAEVGSPAPAPARDRAAVRAELGIDRATPLVLAIARLHPQKGLDVLIDAAARWREQGEPARLVIAGDGPQRDELAIQIERRAAPVRLLGRRADAPDLLAAADVVVLPSRWEARALVAQEAMRLGRPLVTTTVGGLPELVGDGAALVPPDDAAALCAAVLSLLRDPAAAGRLAARALARAADWPTDEHTAAELDALYRELTDRT
jgi:glycosyltransferase involved in cell wall biosynthesis